MTTPVIHRDRTFEYQGKRDQIVGAHASTGNSYEILDMEFNSASDEDWNSMAEVRGYLAMLADNDYPLSYTTRDEWAGIHTTDLEDK